ncbi:hypothetical protein B046DRAFT_04388 [Streptomyces sp. LamerLS-316]|nr:hypothetical protein B046DRAFT_04388 [Streptomyces sp. LamerLS-316]
MRSKDAYLRYLYENYGVPSSAPAVLDYIDT